MTSNDIASNAIEQIWNISNSLGEDTFNALKNVDWTGMKPSEIRNTIIAKAREIVSNEYEITPERAIQLLHAIELVTPKKMNWETMLKNGEIQPGVGLDEPARRKLAAQYNIGSLEELQESLTKAREDYVARQQFNAKNEIAAKREYLYYLTIGEDGEQEKLRKKYASNKNLTKFFDWADREMNGGRGWVAAAVRNISQLLGGGSVMNKYAQDVRTAQGGEHEDEVLGALKDYTRQLGADAAYGAASTAIGGPLGKLAGRVGVPAADVVLSNLANGVGQGVMEGGRELMAGEDLDPSKMSLVGGASAGIPTLFYAFGNKLSKIPGIGPAIRRARHERLHDPVADARDEMSKEANELLQDYAYKDTEVGRRNIQTWTRKNATEAKDRRIEASLKLKDISNQIAAKQKIISGMKNKIAATAKRRRTALNNGDDVKFDLENSTSQNLKEMNKELKKQEKELEKLQLEQQKELQAAHDHEAGLVKDEADRIQKALALDPDELVDKLNGTLSQDGFTLNKHEQRLADLYDKRKTPVVPKTAYGRAMKAADEALSPDVIAYASQNYTREKDGTTPTYTMSKEDRWEDIGPTEEELNSPEYLAWYCDRYKIDPSVLGIKLEF